MGHLERMLPGSAVPSRGRTRRGRHVDPPPKVRELRGLDIRHAEAQAAARVAPTCVLSVTPAGGFNAGRS
jgi:hypothetical protein